MKERNHIRILVVDDHPVVRRGISAALSRNVGFEVVGEVGDGESALQAAHDQMPDVILLDISKGASDDV